MKDRGSWLVIGCLLFIQSIVLGEVQWLQYRSSDKARDIIGCDSSFNRLEKDAPKIDLPQLNTEKPKFVKWNNSMDKGKFRWIVFDQSKKQGPYDVLYIDSDGDGKLDDETKIEGRQSNEYEVEFGKIPVQFEGEDGPITYHLNLTFYSYNERSTYIYVYSGGWYESEVMIDGKPYRFVVVDNNGNGTFNDKSDDFDCDRIKIGTGEDISRLKEHYVGNLLEVGESVYRLNIAKDGAFVEITPATDVVYGTVTLPEGLTEISFGGKNGMFDRKVKEGKVQLPEGKYRISSWEIVRKDDKGAQWRLQGSGFRKETSFSVSKDKAVSLDVGEPIISELETNVSGSKYYFSHGLRGKMGERIDIQKNNNRIPPPKIHVMNEAGTYERTFALQYG